MKHYKISFIVPCYNGFDKLELLLDRFNALKVHPNMKFEVVIIDDGSDSDCKYKLAENTFLHKKTNGGVSSARNVGLSKATGDYIIFIDCDDIIVNETLDILYDNINTNQSDMFLFSHHYINNQYVTKKINKKRTESPSTVVLGALLDKKILFHNCAMVYKKEFLLKNELKYREDIKYSEDVLFIITALNKADLVTVSEKVFYHYIDNESGAINQSFDHKMLNQLHSFNFIKNVKLTHKLNKKLNYFIYTCVSHSLVRAFKAKEYDDEAIKAFIKYSRETSFPYTFGTDKYYLFCLFMRFYLKLPIKLLLRVKRVLA